MKVDYVPPQIRLMILTVPHPATRAAAAFLQTIVCAGNPHVACEIVTCRDRLPGADDIGLYLRPSAADVVALAAMMEPTGSEDIRRGCSHLEDLDNRWWAVPRLSLERVVEKPLETVRFLARHLDAPLGDPAFAQAESGIDALRRATAGHEHPVAFLASVEPGAAGAAWMDRGLYDGVRDFVAPDAPRHLLMLAGSGRSDIVAAFPDAADWVVSEMPLDDLFGARLEAITVPQGIIHLHHVADAACLDDLLDPVMVRLSPKGVLSGEERSETAAENVAARLTKGGSDHGLVVLLSGCRWLAASPAWWH